MNLTLTVNGWLDEEVIFAQQLGVSHVFVQVDLHQVNPAWDPGSLAGLHNRIEKAGLTLAGICAVIAPKNRGLQTGLKKAEALELACRMVEGAGAAGIGLVRLPTSLFPPSPFRFGGESKTVPALTEEKSSTWLRQLAETATQAGVKLAIPINRPINQLTSPGSQDQANQGIPPGLLESFKNPLIGVDVTPGLLLNFLQEHPPAGLNPSTLNSCQPLWDKIFLVTLENNLDRGAKSVRTRLDAGVVDIAALCWQLKQAGYSGLVRLGEQPHWIGDSAAGHRARAFAAGYLTAVLQGIQKEV
jgi:hypothetical protein